MAAAFVKFHTVASNKTSGATLAVALDTTVPAGNLIVFGIVFDNAATASKPALGAVNPITRMAGETNNWVSLGAARSTSTSAGAFASGELWCIQTTVAWSAASYTVTLDTAVTQKAAGFVEYSGTLATLRSTGATNYSTTTTAASATTTGTTPVTGDLVIGLVFNSNAIGTGQDADTTGGSWVNTVALATGGGNVATNNAGYIQHKVLTSGVHQTFNATTITQNAGNGVVVAILQQYVSPAITQAAYGFYNDGTETASTTLAAANTAITANMDSGDVNVLLRERLQITNTVATNATDDWQLQWERTAGTAVLADSYVQVVNLTTSLYVGRTAAAQSFLGNGQYLSSFRFRVRRTGAANGTLQGALWAHTGPFGSTGTATGSPLTTSLTSVAVTSLPDSPPSTFVEFTFDGTFQLANGTPYCIGITSTNTGLSGNDVRIDWADAGTPPPGNASTYDGVSTWSSSGIDYVFELYTKPVTTGNVAPTTTMFDSDTDNSTLTADPVGNGTYYKHGQSFTGTGNPLAGVEFLLRRINSPTFNLTAELYAHTGTYGSGGTPTGSVLATSSTVIAAASLSTAQTWTYFQFDGSFTPVNGTRYFIVLSASAMNDASNNVTAANNGGAATHPGNFARQNSSLVWGSLGIDLLFRIYQLTSPAPTTVLAYNSPNLTDGAATTNRLGAGTGSFVAGKVSEDGLVDDLGWTANNYTEVLYSLTLKAADLAGGDTLRFRTLYNGATTVFTYTQIPTINVTKTAVAVTQAAYRWYDEGTETGAVFAEHPSTQSDINYAVGTAGTRRWIGQSFIGNGQTISAAQWYMLNQSGTATGTVTASIYAVSGTSGSTAIPTGAALATSDTVDVATIGSTAGWVNFPFSGANNIVLTNSTSYIVTLQPTVTAGNLFAGADATAPTHSGNGATYSAVTTVWTSAVEDYCFRVLTMSSPLAAQNTAATGDVTTADGIGQLRVLLQSTTAALLPATDDWQLQWEKNASGTWTNVSVPSLIDLYPETNSEVGTTCTLPGEMYGQSFLGNGRPLSRLSLYAFRNGTLTGNIEARLYAHTGTFGTNGVGTGTPLATSTARAANSLGTTVAWESFTFAGTFTLVNGTAYVIGITTDTTQSADIVVQADATAPTHAGNMSYRSNTGTWSPQGTIDMVFRVDGPAANTVVGYNSPNLTDAAATTNRLTGGTGTFTPGKVSETGLVSDVGWSGNNYTELVYSLDIVNTDVANGDTLRFRVLRNGATTGLTYTQTPTLNAVKIDVAVTQAAYRWYDEGTETGAVALAAQNTAATGDVSTADGIGQLRVLLQSTSTTLLPSTDDWQLQWEKNASGTWTKVSATNTLVVSRYDVSNANTFLPLHGTNTLRGQSFKGDGRLLSQVDFYLTKANSPTGTIVAVLYAHDGGTFGTTGLPTGSPLTTSTTTVDVTTVPTTQTAVTFNFDGSFTLVDGTPYFICLLASGGAASPNQIQMGLDSTSATHEGATASFFAGSWATSTNDYSFEVRASTITVVGYNSPNLTDGAATTNRLTGGSGTFTAGKISETGLVSDVGWSGNNYTELLYSLDVVNTDVVNGDTLRFRVLRNGATTTLTYTQVPTLNVATVAPTGIIFDTSTAPFGAFGGGTSPSITFPLGQVVLLNITCDGDSGNPQTMAVSTSGAALTWTKAVERNASTAGSSYGAYAGQYWTIGDGNAHVITVVPAFAKQTKVHVVFAAGADTTSPIGAVGNSETNSQNTAVAAYTSTVANSRGVAVGMDWNNGGGATSTDSYLAYSTNGPSDGISIWKPVTATVGTAVSFNIQQTATPNWMVVSSEIRPVPTSVSTGLVKWYSGSAFVEKPIKWYSGSAFVAKPLKVWNGSAWVLA